MKRRNLFLFLLILVSILNSAVINAAELPQYKVEVDTVNQLTYVFSKNNGIEYELMDVWATSTGAPGTPTILGEYTLRPLSYGGGGEWYLFKSWPCWVNYVTQIQGNYCFHSPPMDIKGAYEKTPMSSISQMLSARSHGCVRFLPRQAAFMWYNMGGSRAKIYKGNVSEEASMLRARLALEIPKSAANYPDPVITEFTTYWYTYHNDTLDKICSITGRTPEELAALNPEFDFSKPIQPGKAIKIKGEIVPEKVAEEVPEEVQPEAQPETPEEPQKTIIEPLESIIDIYTLQ